MATANDKVLEKKVLLKRVFSKTELFKIGTALNIPYFNSFISGWDINEDEASLGIALTLGDAKLKETFEKYCARDWTVFRGKYYTFEEGRIRLDGSWKMIQANLSQMKRKYGRHCYEVLKVLAESIEGCGVIEIRKKLKHEVDVSQILSELEQLKVIVISYVGNVYREWKILEETLPLIRSELGISSLPSIPLIASSSGLVSSPAMEKSDYSSLENQMVQAMDNELSEYLNALLRSRLNGVVRFGKSFSACSLVAYLQSLFGSMIYFDSLLSIVQQYGLANAEIVHQQGKTGMRTGWSLALFGEPGTGKSFSTRDMILGKPNAKVPPHGIPGRNRYCGGMTPARFIRIGQAYTERSFNFIVPEFNDWFRYSGMVDILKIAMERGEIKYELHREVVGPYRFDSFLSVNYNTTVLGKGYEVTVSDPNFNAIEDRMVCRLHRLTKQRYVEVAQSQMKLALGEIDIEKGAQNIRDHVALVYAIETEHPLVKGQFPAKPVLITPQTYEAIEKARAAILQRLPQNTVRFSARLEDLAIRFACAASLLDYFRSDSDFIPISNESLRYAVQLYVEEASARSGEQYTPEEVLDELSKTMK